MLVWVAETATIRELVILAWPDNKQVDCWCECYFTELCLVCHKGFRLRAVSAVPTSLHIKVLTSLIVTDYLLSIVQSGTQGSDWLPYLFFLRGHSSKYWTGWLLLNFIYRTLFSQALSLWSLLYLLFLHYQTIKYWPNSSLLNNGDLMGTGALSVTGPYVSSTETLIEWHCVFIKKWKQFLNIWFL